MQAGKHRQRNFIRPSEAEYDSLSYEVNTVRYLLFALRRDPGGHCRSWNGRLQPEEIHD